MINISAHRDLKPHNVLIAEDNNEHRVVLADFGISKYIKPDMNATASGYTFNQVGTIGWSAPEAAAQSEREVRIYFLYLTANNVSLYQKIILEFSSGYIFTWLPILLCFNKRWSSVWRRYIY